MKKILFVLLTVVFLGCQKDEIFTPIEPVGEIPEALLIDDLQGIKLESTIVSQEVRMNVKLPYTGEYRIKIRDIAKQLISQEKISGKEGDNLLKVYVSSLDKDGYVIELTDSNHQILGLTTFVVN